MNLTDITLLIAQGESETLELKRSTAQLTRAGESLCAFLNADGGTVIIGATDSGALLGQQISDKTRRDLATMLGRFEPSAPIETEFVDLDDGDKQLIVLRVSSQADARPFAFDGRAYQRVQSTTSVMPQDRYQAMLLERAQARHRWENMPAVGVTLADLDHEEILRTRDAAIRQRRISAGTSTDVADILERLGLLRDGVLTQAAQVLYGTRFLPDYPQGMLKLGRFRGAKITGDILDNRQEHLHAFDMVREAMAWLDRTLPLAAHFPPGEIFREDRLPVPAEALREIILNAVMHRDYTQPGSYVAIAVFDDRIEVRSIGGLPRGVSAESLAAEHRSVLRNPLIAEAFHRTGAVEVWGRGTNRVIEACERYGIEAPVFDERSGAVFVTFRAQIRANADLGHDMGRHGTKSGLSRDQVRVLDTAIDPQPIKALMELCGGSNRTRFRDRVVGPLLDTGLLEMTIPGKPRSSKQRYRTTDVGKARMRESRHLLEKK
jgi:ATP-dependent DNA helicase RecG